MTTVKLELDEANARVISAALILAVKVAMDPAQLLASSIVPENKVSKALRLFLGAASGFKSSTELAENVDQGIDNMGPKMLDVIKLSLRIIEQIEPEHKNRVAEVLQHLEASFRDW